MKYLSIYLLNLRFCKNKIRHKIVIQEGDKGAVDKIVVF